MKRYQEFVLEGIEGQSPWRALKGQILLGGEALVKQFKGLLNGSEEIKEIPRTQRYVTRPAPSEIFEEGKAEIRGQEIRRYLELILFMGTPLGRLLNT